MFGNLAIKIIVRTRNNKIRATRMTGYISEKRGQQSNLYVDRVISLKRLKSSPINICRKRRYGSNITLSADRASTVFNSRHRVNFVSDTHAHTVVSRRAHAHI